MPQTTDIPDFEEAPVQNFDTGFDSQAAQSNIDEFQHLIENPVIGSSDKPKTQELWERLEALCTTAGREDYARQIYNMCATLDNVDEPELSINTLFQKLSAFGDIAIKITSWKSIAEHLHKTLEREFRQWQAVHAKECHQNILDTVVDPTCVVDSGGKGKEYRFTPSSVQLSSARIEEAMYRLFPEEFEIRKIEIEYVEKLAKAAHDIYFIVQAAQKANVGVATSFGKNGA